MKKVEGLTVRLINGQITEDELAELKTMLRKDTMAREMHISLMEIEALLQGRRKFDGNSGIITGVMSRINTERSFSREGHQRMLTVPGLKIRSISAAVAACFFAGIIISFMLFNMNNIKKIRSKVDQMTVSAEKTTVPVIRGSLSALGFPVLAS